MRPLESTATPRKLRATHSDNEQVSIVFKVDDAMQVETALRGAFSTHPFTLSRSETTEGWTLIFSRKADDDILDTVLRVLHRTGGTIQNLETRRATLLEVLESYEEPNAPDNEENRA